MCKLIVQTVQGLHISNDMLQEVHAEFENVDIGELKYVHPEPMHQLAAEGKPRPPFLNGWVMAVQCLLQLWETLHQHYSLRFLFTNRLNQDCIENLFSVIHAKVGQRDNPNASHFRAAFAQVINSIIDMFGWPVS